MSMMVSFVLSFFPRDVLDEILNLIESVSEDFLTTLVLLKRVIFRHAGYSFLYVDFFINESPINTAMRPKCQNYSTV